MHYATCLLAVILATSTGCSKNDECGKLAEKIVSLGGTPDGSTRDDRLAWVKKTLPPLLASACRVDSWPSDVIACAKSAKDDEAAFQCVGGFEGALAKKAVARTATMRDVYMRRAAVQDALGEGATFAASGVPECEAYFKAVDEFFSCDRVPLLDRQDVLEAGDNLRRPDRSPPFPKNDRDGIAAECVKRTEVVNKLCSAAGRIR